MEQLDFVAPENSKPTRRKTRRAVKDIARQAGPGRGPREGHRRLTADIPAELHKRLKMQALMEERTVTDILLDATRAYLSNC